MSKDQGLTWKETVLDSLVDARSDVGDLKQEALQAMKDTCKSCHKQFK